MSASPIRPAATVATPDFGALTADLSHLSPSARSSRVFLIHEELARARVASVRSEAYAHERARRLVMLRRAARRAEQAARRARLAAAAIR